MIEKEVRYQIDDDKIKLIQSKTELIKEENHLLDIVMGKDGFDSLDKNGYIVRIRQKGDKTLLEVKKRLNEHDFEETKIEITDIKNTVKILETIGLKTYLFISRDREKREYNNLHLCIDKIDLLGSYIEIEYQESDYDEVLKFINEFGIPNKEEKLYGDIFKDRIKDNSFKKEFDERLDEILKS